MPNKRLPATQQAHTTHTHKHTIREGKLIEKPTERVSATGRIAYYKHYHFPILPSHYHLYQILGRRVKVFLHKNCRNLELFMFITLCKKRDYVGRPSNCRLNLTVNPDKSVLWRVLQRIRLSFDQGLSRDYKLCNALKFAEMVRFISSWEWAVEMKNASNCDGGR